MHKNNCDDLEKIPGVGPRIFRDLRDIGIRSIRDLQGQDPEKLYDKFNSFSGAVQDRCLLYSQRENPACKGGGESRVPCPATML